MKVFSADFDPPRSSSSNAVHIFRALSQYQSVMFQHMTQLGFADSVLHRDSGVAEPPGAREVFGMESCFPGVAAITKYPKKEESPGFSYCCPGVAIPSVWHVCFPGDWLTIYNYPPSEIACLCF